MTTTSFSYTGSDQDFVVPAGVTTVAVDLVGARGTGQILDVTKGYPGLGGHVAGTITVTPGETLRLRLGQTEAVSSPTPTTGGGGGGGVANDIGHAGGGATDIRRTPYALTDRLMVAAGGGGSSEDFNDQVGEGMGGNGGLVGADGTSRPSAGFPNATYAGKGATASAGGAASGGLSPPVDSTGPGTLGQGGQGASSPSSGAAIQEGGGGGGGLYGGGGGSIYAGGGGGSNYVGTASATTNETGTRTAQHGTASLTYSAAVGSLGYQSDIPFIVANDRHQTVLTADIGTSTTTAEFRYFFADAPMWAEELAADTQYPAYHLVDEHGDYQSGTLELPFKSVDRWQEIQVDGVEVEFATRPTSLANDPVSSVGFSCHVEGYGISGYGSGTGVATSTTLTYVTGVDTQDGTYWPNSRTAYLPVRLDVAVRTARVVLTDIRLVEIKRVKLLGQTSPGRNV